MTRRTNIEGITLKNVKRIAEIENLSINRRTIGERLADDLAAWVGSWPFVVLQSSLLGIWIWLNLAGQRSSWDPYPFVLLNLVLSFQAAFASPIILMSENRQARLSERRNQLDLQINLLAEQENTEQLKLLRLLCEKVGIVIPHPEQEAMMEPLAPETILRQLAEGNFDATETSKPAEPRSGS